MYIEDKKVVSNEKGVVTFEDGSTQAYSQDWANYLITDEPEEYIDHSFRKYVKVVGDVLKHFKEGAFITKDIEKTIACIHESVRNANQEAICQAFGVEQHDQIPFNNISEKSEAFRNAKK